MINKSMCSSGIIKQNKLHLLQESMINTSMCSSEAANRHLALGLPAGPTSRRTSTMKWLLIVAALAAFCDGLHAQIPVFNVNVRTRVYNIISFVV